FHQTVLQTLLKERSIQQEVKKIVKERERVFRALKTIPQITPFPSAANFILFRTPKAETVYKRLLKKGILIRNVSDHGPLKNCLRVSIGSPAENNAFLKALSSLTSN
ncbi:MAG: aminotransferase class I/II-fold pyridoxal phosphate-dependent enzyme, partial [bacterium]|nr:aminotransferase class I/II-fold pyridoxal phosphate-dependent enzyme [bacterium]